MNKNKNKKRLLEDPNSILWQEAKKASNYNQKAIIKPCKARIKYLSQKLIVLKPHPNKTSRTDKEYFKLLEELIFLCQKGFFGLGLSQKDCPWVNEGLTCLLQLYDTLISNTSRNFVAKYQNQVDFDEVKSYTQQLFMRLITGDTPWAINEFKDKEKPTHETKAALSKVKIYKRKKETKEKLNFLIKRLQEKNLHPDDIKLTKYLFQEDMKNFAEWTKQPIYSFPEWVRSTISYEIRLRQEKLALGIIKNKKRVNNLQQDIPKLTKILENKNLFQAFIKENHLIFKKQYEKYKKGCYKDEKYTRYENRGNFTAFTQQCLPLMLIDLYKRKELLKRNKIPLEEVINIGEKPDLDSNIFAKEIIKNLKSLLTPAENRVFKYKLDEWTNVDIAKRLKISKGRISQLVKNIRQKAKKLNFF